MNRSRNLFAALGIGLLASLHVSVQPLQAKGPNAVAAIDTVLQGESQSSNQPEALKIGMPKAVALALLKKHDIEYAEWVVAEVDPGGGALDQYVVWSDHGSDALIIKALRKRDATQSVISSLCWWRGLRPVYKKYRGSEFHKAWDKLPRKHEGTVGLQDVKRFQDSGRTRAFDERG